jgi:hypothetical protein
MLVTAILLAFPDRILKSGKVGGTVANMPNFLLVNFSTV